MSQADLDRMVTEALQRLTYFINRKAGQQVRRMKATWSPASMNTQPKPGMPGVTVTQPGSIDDDEPNPSWPPRYRNAEGSTIPPEAGNVWFASDEPDPHHFSPVQNAAQLAARMLVVLAACSVLGTLCAVVLTAGYLHGFSPAEVASVMIYWALA